MAVASLVCGIVSILFSFIGLSSIGIIIGIIGIVLAVVAQKKEHTSMGTAGMVCSIIGTVLCALIFIACAACLGESASLLEALSDL